jgi:hypothetical protein
VVVVVVVDIASANKLLLASSLFPSFGSGDVDFIDGAVADELGVEASTLTAEAEAETAPAV